MSYPGSTGFVHQHAHLEDAERTSVIHSTSVINLSDHQNHAVGEGIWTTSSCGCSAVSLHSSTQPLNKSTADFFKKITDQPKPVDNLSRGHPGQRVPTHKITTRDQQWQDIGSGMVSRTFKRVSRLRTTSPGGPCIDDVSHRKI